MIFMKRVFLILISFVFLLELNLSAQNSTFTSPDLSMFDVKGRVKSITYTQGMSLPLNDLYKGAILFDTQGRCTNLKSLFFERKQAPSMVVYRNKAGYISTIKHKDGEVFNMPTDFVFKWSGGKLIEYQYEILPSDGVIYKLRYNNSKLYSLSMLGGGDGMVYEEYYVFSNFKYDSKGNWIQCTAKLTGYEEDELEGIKTPIPQTTFVIKRNITYY